MSVMGIKKGVIAGYTLVELMVVVVILTILATGVVWVDSALIGATKSSRDDERASDMKSVALLFEQYYRTSPNATGSSYPTTQQLTSSLASFVPDQELVTPPSLDAPAFLVATDTDPQVPSVDEYIYQPFAANGTLCTTTPPCVRFVLYYSTEKTNEVIRVESSHQQ